MMLSGLLPLLLSRGSLTQPAPQQAAPQAALQATAAPFFRIQVVDSRTQRGVPLVELTTNDGTTYVTDSAGNVAFFEPGLMGQETCFHASSHGYEYPADDLGFRGLALTPTRGGQATITIARVNLAERLYRITGLGIYRDTRLLGLDPDQGIDLTYDVDANGVERMSAYSARLAGLGTLLEHGLAVWDPNSGTLQKVSSLPLDETRHARGAQLQSSARARKPSASDRNRRTSSGSNSLPAACPMTRTASACEPPAR